MKDEKIRRCVEAQRRLPWKQRMRRFGGAGSLIGSVRAEGRMAPGVDSLAKLSGTRAVMAS